MTSHPFFLLLFRHPASDLRIVQSWTTGEWAVLEDRTFTINNKSKICRKNEAFVVEITSEAKTFLAVVNLVCWVNG